MIDELFDFIGKTGGAETLLLMSEDGKTYSEIKEETNLSNGTAQRRLKELDKLGWVKVEAKITADGRATKTYKITESGKKAKEGIQRCIENFD